MGRYQNAGALISKLEKELRSIIMEVTTGYQAGTWHKNDKERIFAHLMHVPLFLRDHLGTKQSEEERLITSQDYSECVISSDLQPHVPLPLMVTVYIRFYMLGYIMSKLKNIKRFPVVQSYTNHQSIFTYLWLILLPSSMTSQTGFFAILWALITAHGILAVESLANNVSRASW